MKKITTISMGLIFSIILLGCASANKSQRGAVIGTAGGAVVGGAIGSMSGHVGLGAIIGAAVGGVTGAVIGHSMDKQAEEIKNSLPDAKVIRVGEGIVVEFSDKVLFTIGDYNLSNNSKTSLDKLNNVITKYPDTNIEIQGHTDNTGSKSSNQTLSEQRSSSVKNYLIYSGIVSSRLTTKGFGEAEPKYDNSTAEGRMLNRNVQFLITANETMKAAAKKEAGSN